MTRLPSFFAFIALVAPVSLALGQTYPSPTAKSSYAPRGQQQPQVSVAGAPAIQQPSRQQPLAPQQNTQPNGPQPTVRQAAGEAEIRQPAGRALVPAAQPAPASPQVPSWVPLDAAHQKWVDDILGYWEARSNKIKTFECGFYRYEYDPVFGPKDVAKTKAGGEIKYAQPDKGLFRVTSLFSYTGPPLKEGDEAQYAEQDASFGEHWVSDGIRVFQFDARGKRLIERTLPPEMQGQAIADGPLPFLFGARAQTIMARYWIHGLPQSGNGKYWLEAVPKSRQDAQNFKMVHIALDETSFLPAVLIVFAPNYDAKTNPSRTTYVFNTIKTNDDQTLTDQIKKGLDPLGLFHKNFYAPKLPPGWQKVVENEGAPSPGEAPLEASRQPPQQPARQFSPLPR
jgi:TIGR03009 family protein